MENENIDVVDIPEIVEIKDDDGNDTTDWKALALKNQGIAKRLKTKLEKSKEVRSEPVVKKEEKKPDDDVLKRLDRLALKAAGINEADEVELLEKWKTETNRDSDSIVDSSIFKKELEELRTAKANLAASSNIKGEPGGSGAKDTPEYWIAKATKDADGKLMFPDEMPKALYSKIVDKLASQDPTQSKELKFYNS